VDKIFVMKSDGSDQRFLAKGYDPRWSPDGAHIAFVLQVNIVGPDVWIMNADGTVPQKIALNSADPSWSPTGKRLAITTGAGTGSGIGIINADGSGLTTLLDDHQSRRPAWSPDGTSILFLRNNPAAESSVLMVMNVDGGEVRVLYPGPAEEAAWSPDGKQIAFVDRTSRRLYRMDADGTHKYLLAQSGYGPAWHP